MPEWWKCLAWQVTARRVWTSLFSGQLRFAAAPLAQVRLSASRAPFRTAIEIVGDEGSIELESPFKPSGDEWIQDHAGDSAELIRVPQSDLYLAKLKIWSMPCLTAIRHVFRWRKAARMWPRFWRCWSRHAPGRWCGCSGCGTQHASPGLLNRDSLHDTAYARRTCQLHVGVDVGEDVADGRAEQGQNDDHDDATKDKINAYSTNP